MQIAQEDTRYLRAPRLVEDDAGGALLRVIAWRGETEQMWEARVSPDGALSSLRAVGEERTIRDVDALGYPTDDPREQHRARFGAAEVSIEHAHGTSAVWLTFFGERTLVYKANGIAACPAVVHDADGAWVAFHHDVREDTSAPDVAKWIALRYVSADGDVYEPAAVMRERDRDLAGVEQSFEFPSLVLHEGALALFGRGSHNYWRQDLNADGFTERQELSDGEWGSRGRRIVAARIDAGVVVARRGRRAIELDVMPLPTGGAPALRRATVQHHAAHVIRAPRDRDPARAYGMHTYFGDIQQHSAHSDGIGCADEPYLRARYQYADDFVALTDHESFIGKRTSPGEWEYLKDVADLHHAPGRFATMIAYEWTGRRFPGPGHKCVYFRERDKPLLSRDDVPVGRDIVEQIAALGGFTSPHHIGWTGCDEDGHGPGQPVWEICSCHGCYEHADHPLGQRGELRDQMVDVMLKKGHRFGFTGSSDSHGLLFHHGEARKRDPFRTGLTGVQASELTREAVFDALMARRCYATSGAKILLDVRANGAPMGSTLSEDEAEFVICSVGEDVIETIELITERGVVHSRRIDAREGELRVSARFSFAYARVTQTDGEMAWSSPVFGQGHSN